MDSTFYNNNNTNINRNQKLYLKRQMNYPLKEKIDNKNNNKSDYSDEEQLIIYPEKKYIFVNEKTFDKKTEF